MFLDVCSEFLFLDVNRDWDKQARLSSYGGC